MIAYEHWAWLGVDNVSGAWYAFWSGIGSDIPIFAAALGLLGHLYIQVRRYNCEVPHCWRITRHVLKTTGHRVCHRHHPDGPPTAEKIAELHRQVQAG